MKSEIEKSEIGKLPTIKNCPFCGGPAAIRDLGYKTGGVWVDWVTIGCTDFPGNGGPDKCGVWTAASTPAEAIEKWNRRAIESKIQTAINNGECPKHLSYLKAEYWKAGARAVIKQINTALNS